MEPRHEPVTATSPSPQIGAADAAPRDRRSAGGLVRPKRLFILLFLVLLTLLDACRQLPENLGNADRELQFDLCEAALEQPLEDRAYQGLDGWFFFTLDLREAHPLYERTAFFAEFSARLKAQGVTLVLLPVTSRAVVRPDTLYLGDPLHLNFDPREAEARYNDFLAGLRAGGVEVFDVLAAARAFDADGGQTFFRRDLHWRSDGANAVFEGVAAQVKRLEPDLPQAAVALSRAPGEVQHRGQFVNTWTSRTCGYLLPAEPHGVYTVTPTPSGTASSEVVCRSCVCLLLEISTTLRRRRIRRALLAVNVNDVEASQLAQPLRAVVRVRYEGPPCRVEVQFWMAEGAVQGCELIGATRVHELNACVVEKCTVGAVGTEGRHG